MVVDAVTHYTTTSGFLGAMLLIDCFKTKVYMYAGFDLSRNVLVKKSRVVSYLAIIEIWLRILVHIYIV